MKITQSAKRRATKGGLNGMPKKPLTGYTLYFRDEREKISAAPPDIARQIELKWRNLDTPTRCSYELAAREHLQQYELEMKVWETHQEQPAPYRSSSAPPKLDTGDCTPLRIFNSVGFSNENITPEFLLGQDDLFVQRLNDALFGNLTVPTSDAPTNEEHGSFILSNDNAKGLAFQPLESSTADSDAQNRITSYLDQANACHDVELVEVVEALFDGDRKLY